MYYDIYVLVNERNQKTIQNFLDTWGEGFGEATVEYDYPRYKDNPETVYQSVDLLVDKLVIEADQPYSIYWNSLDPKDPIRAVMLFFTSDGGLIVGLSSVLDSNPSEILSELMESVNGRLGKILLEQPPPDTIDEFMKLPDFHSKW